MNPMCENRAKLSRVQWAFAGLVFLWCLAGAALIRVEFCPDEWARRLLSDFMVKNGVLPVGEEAEIVMENYGFSYAIYPYLASMLNALCMRIAGIFTGSERVMLAASRMCSVISIGLCAVHLQKIGNLLLRRRAVAMLFAGLTCFLPQVMFLGMYQNNDALALCGIVAVIYSVLAGHRNSWRWVDCIRLGLWTAVTLLSYYNAYGWLLVCGVAAVASFLSGRKKERKEIFLKWAAILGIILAAAGWFFIRNAALHDGDFLGFRTEAADRQRLIEQGWQFKNYRRPSEIPGYTLIQMLTEERCQYLVACLKSFIGVFGNMDLFMDGWVYFFYYAVLLFAGFCFVWLIFRARKTAEEKWFLGGGAAAALITFGLTLYNSYFTDYQPQGRYLIATAVLMAFAIASFVNRLGRGALPEGGGTPADRAEAPAASGAAASGAVADSTGGTASGRITRISWIALLVWVGMFGFVFARTMSKMFG